VKAAKRMVKSLANLSALRRSPAQPGASNHDALAEYRQIEAEVHTGNYENSHKPQALAPQRAG
jgi:hypothetical protein